MEQLKNKRLKRMSLQPLHELRGNLYSLRLCLNQDISSHIHIMCEEEIIELLPSEAADFFDLSSACQRKWIRKAVSNIAALIDRHQYKKDCHESRLEELSQVFGLTSSEIIVLQVAVLCNRHRPLRHIADHIKVANRRGLTAIISGMTGIETAVIERILLPSSTLLRIGLLTISDDSSDVLNALDVPKNLYDALFAEYGDTRDIRALLLNSCRPTTLTIGDFSYLNQEITLITALLRGALRSRHNGINILLYGEPGVGKSELARLIVSECGAVAFSVSDSEDDKPIGGQDRLKGLLIIQKLLSSGGNQMVILDEAEELLDTDNDGLGSFFGVRHRPVSSRQKSWKTRLLEEALVPTIWIANWTDAIDPALLRRFAYTLEVKSPPRHKRLQMLERAAEGVLPLDRIKSFLAKNPKLTPADIERARLVVKLTSPETSQDAERLFVMALNTGGNAKIQAQSSFVGALEYRVDWINASPPVSTLVERLQVINRGRLCFAGPPGTGKTALARHLAECLDRPLIAKTAADLLSKWVGDTEKAIASAFREAKDEGAILLLDEADSFLQDRQGAQRTWEITQVNELLGQFDAYEGLLVLCTNRLATLDPAVLRRMDYKVEFSYLSAEAAREAFLSAAESLNLPLIEAKKSLKDRPIPAGQIAFGDLAAAVRQAQLRTEQPTSILLRYCLNEEVHARRQGRGRAIGFVNDSDP